MNTARSISRRRMLGLTSASLGVLSCFELSLTPLLAAPEQRRFKIGACDWSIGKMADPEALRVAKEIGLDGVQVSLGTAENGMHLRRPEIQERYRSLAESTGVQVASLAIGELNNIPYKSDPRTIEWVRDSVAVSKAMKTKVVLLAFFGNGDLRNDPAGQKEVIRRLKEVAPRAEAAGVVLGIESWLSGEEHLRIIDAVGSDSVQVYYDVCNSNDRGYDIYKEIRQLGRRICEVHAKENGSLLGKGKVDFAQVRKALDDIGYQGWVQIEGAVPNGAEMLPSYKDNAVFLRQVLA